MEQGRYDAIVVGGGHNGLVAAAYLAKQGHRTLVCEAREVVGGAAVTEQPFGPDYKVTSLSYVVSLLPQGVVRDLDLHRHGYKVYPQGPYFAPHARGTSLQLSNDPARRREEIAKFSPRDADAEERWDAWMAGLADVLGPLLSAVPPKVGSRHPVDLASQARLVWRLRGLDTRKAADVTRLFTLSIADLLEEYFESPELQAVHAVSGVIGTWAGPRAPGTAYVMAHHHIGDVGDGKLGSWGFAEGGMGGVSNAIAAAARSFGAEIRTSAPVRRITTRNGRATGVVLEGGEEVTAGVVVAATHPRITFLEQVDRAELPADFVADIERWKTRSGTVKVNLATDRLPGSPAGPGSTPRSTAAPSCSPSRWTTWRAPSRTRPPAGPRRCPSPTSASPRCSTRPWPPRATTSSRCSPSGCPTPGPASRWTRSWRPTPTGWWPGWSGSPPGSPTRSCSAR